jgi:hypothetical protein
MFRWQLCDEATPISKARGGGYVAVGLKLACICSSAKPRAMKRSASSLVMARAWPLWRTSSNALAQGEMQAHCFVSIANLIGCCAASSHVSIFKASWWSNGPAGHGCERCSVRFRWWSGQSYWPLPASASDPCGHARRRHLAHVRLVVTIDCPEPWEQA